MIIITHIITYFTSVTELYQLLESFRRTPSSAGQRLTRRGPVVSDHKRGVSLTRRFPSDARSPLSRASLIGTSS